MLAQDSPAAEPCQGKQRVAVPCCWVPPSSQHTATAAIRKHFSLLGRKNSHLIWALAFSSFGKSLKILQKEDRSWGVVSWRKPSVVFGWFVSYVILSVLPGPSHATSFLLCVFTCNTTGNGWSLLGDTYGPLSTSCTSFFTSENRGSSKTALPHFPMLLESSGK